MNNLDQIEATAKRSKALREAATKGKWQCGLPEVAHHDDPRYLWVGTKYIGDFDSPWLSPEQSERDAAHAADAHNAALDEVCLSLCKEVRELRAEVRKLQASLIARRLIDKPEILDEILDRLKNDKVVDKENPDV